ncbi:MAG: ABC transporter ATP-binding protein [Thermodesulfobacteriota bacterium]
MADLAISVENLAKEYQIGKAQSANTTMVELISEGFKAPFRRAWGLMRGQASAASELSESLWALKDVSFTVQPGEVVGLIGRNGAGKSTLLKILSRITAPTRGRAEIHGRVGSLLEVGTGFHPELTGRDNIYLNGAILGMSREEIRGKFDQIVAFAEIEKFLDTPVKHYSSGMYVRLAFAVAANLEPEILLVDEVLAVGDKAFQDKCLNKMDDISHSGRTVLFVSHNMAAVLALCSRVVFLENGRVAADGPSQEVVQSYLSHGAQTVGERVFASDERPGNSSFEVVAVRFLDSAGRQAGSTYISQPSGVEVEYEVKRQGARAMFSMVLFDANTYCLFGSLSNTDPEFYGKPLDKGRYRSRCVLPADFLNSGRYYVSITGATDYWRDGFRADHAISFDAMDDGKLKGDYPGGYGGSLRPRLTWTTERVR